MLLHGYFPEPRVASEARSAVAAGFEVDIVALRREDEPPSGVVEGARVVRLPVQHRRGHGLVVTALEYGSFTARATVAAAGLALRRRYDVVQVHSPPDFLVVAAAIPRLLGARLVLDVHDLSSDMFMMRFERRPGARLADRILRLLERRAGRAASTVLTVHEPYRQELGRRGIPLDRIVVVMNSLDDTLLPAGVATQAVDEFTVIYHGTLTPHYGVALVVDAAGALSGRIPNLAVEIYGEGDALPALRERARRLGVEDVVRFSGYLPQAEVLRAAQKASVGVVPNLPTRLNRFALSTKLLEYVALGVPVVSADLPTIREHFADDEVRYFRAGDADALAEALADVAMNREAAAARAAAARRRYEGYRWDESARRYIAALAAAGGTR
jgi:glycosyltransferase involved in cell wall biosynthesis